MKLVLLNRVVFIADLMWCNNEELSSCWDSAERPALYRQTAGQTVWVGPLIYGVFVNLWRLHTELLCAEGTLSFCCNRLLYDKLWILSGPRTKRSLRLFIFYNFLTTFFHKIRSDKTQTDQGSGMLHDFYHTMLIIDANNKFEFAFIYYLVLSSNF